MNNRSFQFLLLLALLCCFDADAQCNICGYREKLKPYDTLLSQTPENAVTRKGQRKGLWDFAAKESVLYGNYWGLDTTHGRHPIDSGTIRCRGRYDKKGIPQGVWIKYMRGYTVNQREYFFFENGVCIRHAYYDMHNGWWMYDSLNPTRDTLITPFFHAGGGYDLYIYYCNRTSNFSIGDKYLLPKDSCFFMRKYAEGNWIQTDITDPAGKEIFSQGIGVNGDTTTIVTDIDEETYEVKRYLNWPENQTPFQTKKYRRTEGEDIELKE